MIRRARATARWGLLAWVALSMALALTLGSACLNGASPPAGAGMAGAPAVAVSTVTARVEPAVPATPTASPEAAALRAAAPRVRTVVIDPGHAADESGAAANGVVEKESNLEMAFRVERLLSAEGIRVVLTRRSDVRANSGPPVMGFSATRLDLQARIDLANAQRGDVFVSIHSNGSVNTVDRGVEAYYNSSRPFAERNRMLAELLLAGTVEALRAAGFPAFDRGALDDKCLRAFQGRCFPLFVLGPARETTRDEVIRRGGDPVALGFAPGQDAIISRATQMPGALIELLFISSPADAAILQGEAAREAMARGIVRGILDYLARDQASAG